MKKLIAHLLLAVLMIVSSYGLFACRTIKKDRARADSTVTRYEQESKAWESQASQELIIETDDVAFIQPGLPLPAILDLNGLTAADQLAADVFSLAGQVTGKAPPNTRRFNRITYRTQSKAAGAESMTSAEHKQVATSSRIVSKEPAPWSWLSIALVIIGVLVVGAIYSRTKRS